MVQHAARAVDNLRKANITHIRFLVWSDTDQPDSDCGETFNALSEFFIDDAEVTVLEVGNDLFVGALNAVLPALQKEMFTHMLTLSVTASAMITQKVTSAMYEAIDKGALAVAVVHPEFSNLVRCGFITNTHALWNIDVFGRTWRIRQHRYSS